MDKKGPVGRSGFFVLFFIFYRLGCTEKIEEKNFFQTSWKKSSSRPFLAHSGGGQETSFYLRVAKCTQVFLEIKTSVLKKEKKEDP